MQNSKPTTLPLVLTVADACRYSALSRTRLYTLLADGSISARKVAKRTLVERQSLDAFMAGRTTYYAARTSSRRASK
jgi:excisionase family DNA binding protein